MLPLILAAAFVFGASAGFAQSPSEDPKAPTAGQPKVSGPFIHETLSIYLIHGPSADGPVPLTLSEALALKLFKVHETGNVSELALENTGDEPVFLQAGDIVKGGRQDRVLTASVVVPGKSGRMPIGAYCVEQSRWSARGAESVRTFESSERSMPSKRAKYAMMGKPVSAGNDRRAEGDGGEPARRQGYASAAPGEPSRQQEVWASVAETQMKLSANLGAPVASPASETSLQLSLENEKLEAAKQAYLAALKPAEKDLDDVVGFAFAVNGHINSADVYPSHGLFAKMWGKLIDAAVTEAITESAKDEKAAPSAEAVRAFLARASSHAAAEQSRAEGDMMRVVRQNEAAVVNETRQRDGRMVHKSFVAF